MYYRVFMNDQDKYYTFLGSYNTLEEAAQSRDCSGDLIIGEDNKVVQDDSWLFSWEKEAPTGYAKGKIRDADSPGKLLGVSYKVMQEYGDPVKRLYNTLYAEKRGWNDVCFYDRRVLRAAQKLRSLS